MCVLGIVAAVVIGRLTPHNGSEFSLGYLFLSASVAICAMILPGISGAFVLLLFGVYHSITGMIKDTAKGNVDLSSLVQLGVFAMGCLFGLLAFSRVLKWLLEHYKNATLATLVGLMLGSVDKLWPLQVPTPETAALKMKERVMVRMSPAEWDGNLWLLAGLAISAAAAVLLMERIANHKPPIDFETAD
jgi:putative membrane protein